MHDITITKPTTKEDAMTAQQVKRIIEEKMHFDSVSVRGGIVICKRTYYYKHEMTPESLAQGIQFVLPQVRIVSARDCWKAWPATSYMEVRCQFVQ